MTQELCSRTGDFPDGLDGLPETTSLAFELHSHASTSSNSSQFLFYFVSSSLDFQTSISSHEQSTRLLVSVYHFCCQIRSQWITQQFTLRFLKSRCASESVSSYLANEKPELNSQSVLPFCCQTKSHWVS